MDNLEIGTDVLVLSNQGQLTYSPVIAFMEKDTKLEYMYTTIETENGTTLTLTRSHLIYRANHRNYVFQKPENVLPIYITKIKVSDYVFTLSKEHNQVQPSKVVKVTNIKKMGVYAPLTLEGTVVVDGVLTSCYAVIDDNHLAHTTLRFLYHFMPNLLMKNHSNTLGICTVNY